MQPIADTSPWCVFTERNKCDRLLEHSGWPYLALYTGENTEQMWINNPNWAESVTG